MNKLPKHYKYLLIASIIFNIICIGFFVGKRIYYYRSSLPENRADIIPQPKGFVVYKINIKEYNKQMFDYFKALPHDTTDIVFVGTSLTQGFPLTELFKDCRLKNRGIGGNRTNDILNRLSEVTDGKPAKIFLEVGSNDIQPNCITDTIFNNFLQIINRIQKASPKTKLYVQSVLPFGRNNISYIESYNERVKAYCSNNGITFINIYPLFLQNGTIKKELTTDGTHLKAAGYLIWKYAIEKYL